MSLSAHGSVGWCSRLAKQSLMMRVRLPLAAAVAGKMWSQKGRGLTQVPDAKFSTKLVNGIPVVEAPEDIDISNASELRAALLAQAEQGHSTFVIDMSRTVFCDTAGLHILVLAHKWARADGGEVRLVVPSLNVLRIFSITGVDRVLPRFPSLDKALAAGHVTDPGQPQPASSG